MYAVIHIFSWSGIKDHHQSTEALLQTLPKRVYRDIQECDTLMIDEISMVLAKVVDMVSNYGFYRNKQLHVTKEY